MSQLYNVTTGLMRRKGWTVTSTDYSILPYSDHLELAEDDVTVEVYLQDID